MTKAAASQKRIRILIAKPGLDGHDRGAKVVARALRDAGMEVIYTGLRQTPEQITNAALQEDVDVVGLSVLSGAHMTLFPRVRELLVKAGADDVVVLGGGIIPEADVQALLKKGLYAVFGPGTNTQDIVATVRTAVSKRRRGNAVAPGRPRSRTPKSKHKAAGRTKTSPPKRKTSKKKTRKAKSKKTPSQARSPAPKPRRASAKGGRAASRASRSGSRKAGGSKNRSRGRS